MYRSDLTYVPLLRLKIVTRRNKYRSDVDWFLLHLSSVFWVSYHVTYIKKVLLYLENNIQVNKYNVILIVFFVLIE